jgi:hypothetical protein
MGFKDNSVLHLRSNPSKSKTGLKLEPLDKYVNTLQGHIEVFFLIGLNVNNNHARGTKIFTKITLC